MSNNNFTTHKNTEIAKLETKRRNEVRKNKYFSQTLTLKGIHIK